MATSGTAGERFARFATALARDGLDLVGCLDPGTACGLPLESIRTVVLCGSGGRRHWQSLTAADRAAPHGIEAAARRTVDRALPLLGAPARQLTADETHRFDLRRLAYEAGWGIVSPYLQLLIHPEYGPWVGIRALVVTDLHLPRSAPLEGFDPCGPCPRPCLDVCPVGAYRRGAAWDMVGCAEHRMAPAPGRQSCEAGCHSRLACVVGREHIYDAAEYRHRHHANDDDLRAFLASQRGERNP